MPVADLKQLISRRALELGFDACRFTTAMPPESASHLRRWLDAGWHGEMAWLARGWEKRADPQRVLPGAKSIVCLGAAYPAAIAAADTAGIVAPRPPEGGTPNGCAATRLGVIARYARFRDYHDVLAANLKLLAQFLDELAETESSANAPGSARSLWYVDTGPILERDLAQRAGLGFIGKHTNLISRELGNWFFLAEILTPLELPPDESERNRCGHCSLCLTACPAQAIVAPFQLDARRCISYLTIELKGPIPTELRPLIGRRIFGCDDCLAVCPWNRFARAGQMMKPHARADLAAPDLLELLALDEAGFKQRFHGTPIARARRRGLLRNVCVALGNAGDRCALPALEKAAQDREPLIAEHARWAIEKLTQPR